MRTVGVIGDSNGDGDPGMGGVCSNPSANILDVAQVGSFESYLWRFDFDSDNVFDASVALNSDAITVSPPAGATSFAMNGTDLEVKVAGMGLPANWRTISFAGSTTEGLSEDGMTYLPPTSGTCSPVKTEDDFTWGRVKNLYR